MSASPPSGCASQTAGRRRSGQIWIKQVDQAETPPWADGLYWQWFFVTLSRWSLLAVISQLPFWFQAQSITVDLWAWIVVRTWTDICRYVSHRSPVTQVTCDRCLCWCNKYQVSFSKPGLTSGPRVWWAVGCPCFQTPQCPCEGASRHTLKAVSG